MAARIAQRLAGAPRRIALSMTRDLYPIGNRSSESDGTGKGARRQVGPRDAATANRLGIRRLLDRIRKDLHPGKQDPKGDKLNVFFGSTRLHRKRGQRMAESDQYYLHALEQIKDLGIVLDNDVQGFFYVQMGRLEQ